METTRAYAYRFRLLWLATVAGYLAGSIAKLALPVYAARETGSPLVVSAVVLGFTAPRLVLGLPFGVLVDRRKLLIGAHAVRLLVLALPATAALAGAWQIPLVVAAATVVGAAEIVDEPALTALVPMLVPSERLDGANRRLIAAETVVEIISQPIGGVPLWGVVTRTLQQRIASEEVIGRVSAAYRFAGFGTNALGTLAGGAAAALWGTDAVFLGAGTLTLLMLVPFQRSVTAQAVATAGSQTGMPMPPVS